MAPVPDDNERHDVAGRPHDVLQVPDYGLIDGDEVLRPMMDVGGHHRVQVPGGKAVSAPA